MLMNKGTSVHVMALKMRMHEDMLSAAQREEGYKENDYEMRHLVSASDTPGTRVYLIPWVPGYTSNSSPVQIPVIGSIAGGEAPVIGFIYVAGHVLQQHDTGRLRGAVRHGGLAPRTQA